MAGCGSVDDRACEARPMATPDHSPARPGRPGTAFVADLACLVAFAVVGRLSHREALDPIGVATTLWPFLTGLLVAWLAGRLWRAPARVAPAGLLAWAGALVVGMLLRAVSGQGVQVAFVVVAAVVLAVLLLGWRALLAATARRRLTRAGSGSPSS
jgi:peptidoglycan/LPS O-acetylase OafA/YrhL